MKRVLVIAVALLILSSTAFADPPERGTVKLGGYTALVFGKQTVTPEGEEDTIDLTTQTIAADLVFFLSERWAFGVLATRDGFKMTAPGDNSFEAYGTMAGPEIRYRIGLSDRADFSILGAGGLVTSTFSGSAEEMEDTDTGFDGTFVLAGAFLHYYVTDTVSFDAGVNYQRSSLHDKDDSEDKFTSAGLGFRVGFSIYFNKR